MNLKKNIYSNEIPSKNCNNSHSIRVKITAKSRVVTVKGPRSQLNKTI